MATAPAIIGVIDDAQPVVGLVDHLGFTNDASPTLRVSIADTGAAVGGTLTIRHFLSGAVLAPAVSLTAEDLARGYVDVAMPAHAGEYAVAAVLDDAKSDLFVYRLATATPQTPHITTLFEDPNGAWTVIDDGDTTDTTPIVSVFMPSISHLTAPPPPGRPPYGEPSAIIWGKVELYADGVLAGEGVISTWGEVQFVLDPLAPGDYDFTVRAVDRAGNASALSAPVEFTILGDAPPPPPVEGSAVSLSGPASTAEGSGGLTAFTFTLTRTGDLSQSAMVDYFMWAPDTDVADFAGDTAGTARFAAGQAVQTITINVVGDTTAEGDEAFNLIIANPRGVAIQGPDGLTATIIDDDAFTPPPPPPPPPPADATEIGVTSAVESGDGAMLTFTVTRAGDLSGPTLVDWFVWGETVDGSDFNGDSAGTVRFKAGEATQTIVLTAAADGLAEAAEGFNLILGNPRGGVITQEMMGGMFGPNDLFV